MQCLRAQGHAHVSGVARASRPRIAPTRIVGRRHMQVVAVADVTEFEFEEEVLKVRWE